MRDGGLKFRNETKSLFNCKKFETCILPKSIFKLKMPLIKKNYDEWADPASCSFTSDERQNGESETEGMNETKPYLYHSYFKTFSSLFFKTFF